MRKSVLFILFAILIAPNAWAVSGSVTDDTWVCPNGYTVCSAYIHCCVPPGKQCNAENCRSSGTILPTKCPDECQNSGTWTNTTDGTNRQVMCMNPYSESAYCSYRCKENYYGAEFPRTVVGSGPITIFSCAACPANATCEDQTAIGPNCNSGYYRHAVLCRKPGSTGISLVFYYTYECLPCPSGASCDGGAEKPVCDENTELMPIAGIEIPVCTDYRQSTTDSDGCGVTYSCHTCPTFSGMWPGETRPNVRLPGITGAPGSTLVENSDGITSCYAIKGATVMDETGMFEVVQDYCKYQE